MDANVKLAIPEHDVKQAIALAVGEALSKNTPALVQAIVTAALMNPPERSFDRTSPLEKAVMSMVRDEASSALKAWVEERRPKIQAMMKAALDKSDFTSAIAAACTDSMAKNVFASVSANVVVVRKEDSD